jgi:hypothetical protein
LTFYREPTPKGDAGIPRREVAIVFCREGFSADGGQLGGEERLDRIDERSRFR